MIRADGSTGHNDTWRGGHARRCSALRPRSNAADQIFCRQTCHPRRHRHRYRLRRFRLAVAEPGSRADRNADGIVVLTGGTSRVTDALELLAPVAASACSSPASIPAPRPPTSPARSPTTAAFCACCVDLDYSAINTLGNAVQTRRWALDRGFHSLIIVTSAYHMPRALAEIAHQLPDVTLIPIPVVSDRLRVEPWWSNGEHHATGAVGIFQIFVRQGAHAL